MEDKIKGQIAGGDTFYLGAGSLLLTGTSLRNLATSYLLLTYQQLQELPKVSLPPKVYIAEVRSWQYDTILLESKHFFLK